MRFEGPLALTPSPFAVDTLETPEIPALEEASEPKLRALVWLFDRGWCGKRSPAWQWVRTAAPGSFLSPFCPSRVSAPQVGRGETGCADTPLVIGEVCVLSWD